MRPEDKAYRGRVVRLTELAGDDGILEGFTFDDCTIRGPAVVVPQGTTTFAHSNLGGDLDAILWEIPPERPRVTGAILAVDCTFEGCTFVNVGFAGPPELMTMFRSDVS